MLYVKSMTKSDNNETAETENLPVKRAPNTGITLKSEDMAQKRGPRCDEMPMKSDVEITSTGSHINQMLHVSGTLGMRIAVVVTSVL